MIMNHSRCVNIVVALFLVVSYLPLACSRTTQKILKFSNQSGPAFEEATNFATLDSNDLSIISSNRLTICGSIYIGFYRGSQVFYTVRSREKLWFSMALDNQDTTEEIYSAFIKYFGGTIGSIAGAKLTLNPHSWSHACTSVDGNVIMVVINGVLMFNTTISSNDFNDNLPTMLRNNLVLGAYENVYQGASYKSQSEASVKNVNVFSGSMQLSEMINISSSGQWTDGDIVSWSKSLWTFSGSVKEVFDKDIEKKSQFPHLFKIGDVFNKWSDCASICPRIQPGGRLPQTGHSMDYKHLSQIYSQDWIWAPFVYQTKGNFSDYHTKTALAPDFWAESEPNGGLREKCTFWLEGKLFDLPCTYWSRQLQCLCQFDRSPITRLRGLCHGSKIDTHYTLRNVSGSVVFMGLKGTVVRFKAMSLEWTLNVNLENTIGLSTAEEISFIMGRHEWSIVNDSAQCNRGKPHTSQLKMSGCKTEGEFTCDDGQCVTMEQRCDQVPDCSDESDERRCKMLLKKEGYNKEVPPFTMNSKNNLIIPVHLNISIDLLKIVDIEETNHKIDFQFKITIEWRENKRVLYHNLKHDTSLNALTKNEIKSIWLPLVIYDNTDQKQETRLGEYGNGEWNTHISVIREGEFTRSGLDIVDETEIFGGRENTLFMQQVTHCSSSAISTSKNTRLINR